MTESDFNYTDPNQIPDQIPGQIPEQPPEVALEGLPEIEEPGDDFLSRGAREFDMSKNAGLDEEEVPSETRESFSALKESISQGRELKAREKEREALAEQIRNDREELADREDILINYTAIAGEQDAILAQKMQERQDATMELNDTVARTQNTEHELERMRSYHAQQLKPLEASLGQAKAAADQAKNDERSRKSELNAVESEIRKSEGGDVEIAQAKQRLIMSAYNEAKARTEGAKDVLKQAEKAYNNARKQFDSEETPIKKEIKQLKDRADDLKKEIESLDETISRVQTRRQYVEDVYRNPDETAELRASVASDEAAERQMGIENDQLREQLEETKSKAKKAKMMVIGIVAAIIVVIILVIVLIPKGGGGQPAPAAGNTSAPVEVVTDTSGGA